MTDTWLDSEIDEAFDDGEADYDESFDIEADDEASALVRRRRARARQLDLARRRRAALARARGQMARTGRTGPPAPRSAVAAIRNLDLENKVQADYVRSALESQNKRQSRSEAATVASVVVGQVQNSFAKSFGNPFTKAALSFAPLLLLSPRKKGTGLAAFAWDPRVIAAALVGGIAIIGDRHNKPTVAKSIDIAGVRKVAAATGSSRSFTGDVLDGRGQIIANPQITWESSDTNIATVDSNGKVTVVTATRGDAVIITARAGNVFKRIEVEIT